MKSRSTIEYFYFIEAWGLLHFSRLLVLFFPFKKIASIMGVLNVETTYNDVNNNFSNQIEKAIQRASHYSIHSSKCYDQALAGKLMCNWRKLPSTIYFGLSKNEKQHLIAHAWLRVGNRIITGKHGHGQYTVVASYGDDYANDKYSMNKNIETK
jgi:hypothetical protein